MKFSMMTSTIATVLVLATCVSAHSWVWCTDYDVNAPGQAPNGPEETDPARRTFDAARCSGWPPNFDSAFFDPAQNSNFGVDFGFEDRPQLANGEFCLQRPNTYSDRLPMATYTAGEIVTIVYPAKNHVAARTTSEFIPDAGVAVYMAPLGSPVTNTNFPSNDAFRGNGREPLVDFNQVHTNGRIDYLGFQNCPNFDAGNDRATCTMDFQLPANLSSGEYFFGWHWEFNTGEHYTTCWSAMVNAAGAEPAPTTTRATTQATQPTTRRTTTQRTTTQPVQTVAGAECSIDGRAACEKGLTPPRGTCVVTDENDPNGFVCMCADGFENAMNRQTCNLEAGVRIRIVLNVEYRLITDFELFERALELELSDRINVATDRLSLTFNMGTMGDETGLVVAILSVAGASQNGELSAQAFYDQLSLRSTNERDSHAFGAMSNAVSIRCLDCPAGGNGGGNGGNGNNGGDNPAVEEGNSPSSGSNALVPSLALVATAALSSLLH